MPLKTRRTGNAEYGRFIKALFIGEPGAGKTLISSTFPDPFFVSAEGGLMSIAERDLPYIELENTEDLFELKTYLELPPEAREQMMGAPVQTVVIDTIDEVQRLFIKERLAKEKKDQMTLPDWGWLSSQMQTLIRSYRNLPMNVILTCHVKETRDDELGRIVYKPGLQGAIADQIAGYVDLSLLLTSHLTTAVIDNASQKVLRRELQTFPDVQHPWIKDRSGKLGSTFPVNFVDDYARLHALIYANVQTTPVAPSAVEKISVPEKAEVVVENVAPEVVQPEKGQGFICEACATTFDDSDQAELSKIRRRKILCSPCYKAKN